VSWVSVDYAHIVTAEVAETQVSTHRGYITQTIQRAYVYTKERRCQQPTETIGQSGIPRSIPQPILTMFPLIIGQRRIFDEREEEGVTISEEKCEVFIPRANVCAVFVLSDRWDADVSLRQLHSATSQPLSLVAQGFRLL
jgi:hypothetical protein